MRLLTIICFVSFSIIFSSQSAFAQSGTKQQSTDYSQYTHTIKSVVLNEERTVVVQLPKSYQAQPNKVYPVVYRLDGAGNIPLASVVIERLQNDKER